MGVGRAMSDHPSDDNHLNANWRFLSTSTLTKLGALLSVTMSSLRSYMKHYKSTSKTAPTTTTSACLPHPRSPVPRRKMNSSYAYKDIHNKSSLSRLRSSIRAHPPPPSHAPHPSYPPTPAYEPEYEPYPAAEYPGGGSYALAALQTEHASALAEADGIKQANARLRAEIGTLESRLEEETGRAAALPRLEGQIKAMQATIARLNEEIAAAASRDADATAARSQLERKYYSATAELERMRVRVGELEGKVAAADAAEAGHARTAALVHDLRAKLAENGSVVAQLKAKLGAAEAGRETQGRELAALQGKVAELKGRLEDAQAQNSASQSRAADLEHALMAAQMEASAAAERVQDLEGLRSVLEDQVVAGDTERREIRESFDVQLRTQTALVLRLKHELNQMAQAAQDSASHSASAEGRIEDSAQNQLYALEAALRHKELELEQVLTLMRDLTAESKAQITALRHDNAQLQALVTDSHSHIQALSSPARARLQASGTRSLPALVESLVAENDSLATDVDAMQRVIANQKLRLSMLMARSG